MLETTIALMSIIGSIIVVKGLQRLNKVRDCEIKIYNDKLGTRLL